MHSFHDLDSMAVRSGAYPTGWFLVHPLQEVPAGPLPWLGGTVVSDGRSARFRDARGERRIPVRMVHGAMFGWYHPDGADPSWDLSIAPRDEFPEFSFFTVVARTTPALIMRDLAAYEHFEGVHQYREFEAVDEFETQGAFAHLRGRCIRDQKTPVGTIAMRIVFDCKCDGLGLQVTDVWVLRNLLRTRHLVCPVPIDERHCRITLGVTAALWLSRHDERQGRWGRWLSGLGAAFIPFFQSQYRRDIQPDVSMWEELFAQGVPQSDASERMARYEAWAAGFSPPRADAPVRRAI